MMRALSRLRWQLTLSHLVAIAFTLITMIAAVIFIGSSWFARQTGPADEPAQIAQVVAGAVEGIVAGNLSGASPTASGDLDRVLSLLAKGELSVRFAPPFAPEQAQRNWWFGGPLHDISYIAVVRPDGTVLGSSDPSGAAFAPADRAAWAPLVAATLSRGGDTFRANAIRPAGVPATLGAYPVRDGSGRPMAVVLVESTVASPASTGFIDFWRVLAFFTTASILVLAGASIFALISASAVGYFLARRLVARLERLGRAAEEFASGDLGRRVEEGADDEVGRLARQFNRMAARLSSTVAQLEAERQHAEAALRAKRELVANVSHELRTPLASIRGHTESLLMRDAGSVDGARREYLNVIDREAKQLGRLIEDLFTLSTAEAGALPLSLGPTNIGEAIDEAVSGILPMARTERRVSVVTRVDPGLGPALADPQRVVQVLGNLLRNALRYTPEGGLIAVRASQRDGRIEVAVEDTGIGIPADQLPHVFERFYRGDASRDRTTAGAGLGLAIVRELVEAMGGSVSVESVVGQGSRFTFVLPLAGTPGGERDAGARASTPG